MNRIVSAFAVGALAAGAFAQAGHYAAYQVSSDFHEVANAKQFFNVIGLSPSGKVLLRKNLFVVTPGEDEQLEDVYGDNDYRNLPSLVTADSVLHIYHVFYDGLLRGIETNSLSKIASRMIGNSLKDALLDLGSETDTVANAAAARNVAYFCVAAKLMGVAEPAAVPAPLSQLADQELSLISASQGYEQSPIFGWKIDYSQFIVRGHYTRTELLQKYFRAMTWLAEAVPLLDLNKQPYRDGIAQAVLLARIEAKPEISFDWKRIFDVTALFVGPPDSYTPTEVLNAAGPGFAFSNGGSFDSLVAALEEIRLPEIVSKKQKTGANSELTFGFLGKRFIPDSMAIQLLTGDARPMPSGLDVMAVLGSREAESILDASPALYNPADWSDYVPVRDDLATQFQSMPAGQWNSNLYWGWLDMIRGYLLPTPTGYPSFMRSEAWSDKKLSTALGSWTELRHDTILYGLQSAAEQGGPDEVPPYVPEFVEPAPQTFGRVAKLLSQTQSELRSLQVLTEDASSELNGFIDTTKFLESIARKELAGTPVTNEENTRIRNIEGPLSDATMMMLKYGTDIASFTEDDLDMSLVADVHTAGDKALEEATGHGDVMIAVVPINGKLYFARGDVFSYYEFTSPISHRLTDTEWKHSVQAGKVPSRPQWVHRFFSSTPATEKN